MIYLSMLMPVHRYQKGRNYGFKRLRLMISKALLTSFDVMGLNKQNWIYQIKALCDED